MTSEFSPLQKWLIKVFKPWVMAVMKAELEEDDRYGYELADMDHAGISERGETESSAVSGTRE